MARLYKSFAKEPIWLIDRSLTGTTAPVQSGHGSNDNEGMMTHSSELQNCLVSYPRQNIFGDAGEGGMINLLLYSQHILSLYDKARCYFAHEKLMGINDINIS